MGRTVRRNCIRKNRKTLPIGLKVTKISRKTTSSVRAKKSSLGCEVDIVDVSGLSKPCINKKGTRLPDLPDETKHASVFLDFVNSCEEATDMVTDSKHGNLTTNSVSYFTNNLQLKSKEYCPDNPDPEIFVVDTDIHIKELSVNEYQMSDLKDVFDHDHAESDLTLNDTFTNESHFEITNADSEHKPKFVLCRKGYITVIVLAHPVEVCFKGRAKIRPLLGCCEILGFEFKASDRKTYDVISPRSNSALTIKTLSGHHQNNVEKAIGYDIISDSHLKELLNDMAQLSEGECVVIACDRLTSPLFDYLVSIPSYIELFKMDDNHAQYNFSSIEDSDTICVSVSDEFETVLGYWINKIRDSQTPIVMVIGGKNSGKSTLNRILVNSALNITNAVSFLDCDVGQAELTPPGFVSLHHIHDPIFGPPFSHQQDSEQMCYYGETTPSKGLNRYIKSVQFIFSLYIKQQHKLPLVVNTLGWNEGLGLKIIIDLIHMMQPSIVVQLDCEYQYRNLPQLTAQYLTNTPGWMYNVDSDLGNKITKFDNQTLFVVDSEVPAKHKLLYKAAEYRELNTISYLNRGLNYGNKLLKMEPFKINFKDIAIHDCQNPGDYSQILYSLNASIVGLCEVDMNDSYRKSETGLSYFKETPVCSCVGVGIVRAVDIKMELLYVTTPVPCHKLANVNLLIKGAVPIPDSIFLQQLDLIDTTELPYLGQLHKTIGSSALNIRSKMPRKQYLNHKN